MAGLRLECDRFKTQTAEAAIVTLADRVRHSAPNC